MPEGRLVIGTKRYSSWSMRGWLAVHLAGLDVEEVVIPLAGGGATTALKSATPTGMVPYLEHRGARVWESLAICDYCAEIAPKLWPADRAARAHARSIAAEMHAGFRNLRMAMPMNLGRSFPGRGRTPESLADIARVEAIWAEAIAAHGGPFLMGAEFGAADAMYAPVVARFITWQPELSATTQRYMAAVRAHPLVARWYDEAAAEPVEWLLDRYEKSRMNTALALDHLGVAARDLAPMCAAYERLGFTLSPIAQQSGRRRPDLPVEKYGSGNRCAFLKHGYIELIAILDPALFDNNLNAFLARYAGIHILALAMLDEEANLVRLRQAGIDIPGVAYLERPVEAGGPIARFARLPFPDPPEGRVQLIRHLTPELVWQDRWMDHANRAEVLEAAILCADNPADTAARLSRLAGLPLEPDPAGGFLLRLPGAARAAGPKAPALETRVRVLTPEALATVLPGVTPPASPCMAGIVVRTADGAASARRILAGIPTREAPEGIMVPPEYAAGAALIFT